MLKIEIVRFETQDVITTSVPIPSPIPSPIPRCECPDDGRCFPDGVFSLEEHNRQVAQQSCSCFMDKHSLGN